MYLEAIKRICEWEFSNNINLSTRFQRCQFLSGAEVDSLACHLQAARRSKPGAVIGRGKYNTYLGHTADYLRWLADEVLTDANAPAIRDAITDQDNRIRGKVSRRAGSRAAREQRILTKRLPDGAMEQLKSLFDNPFQRIYRKSDKGSRLRNVLMLRVLYETGMRRGELLGLKLRNLLESGGSGRAFLEIERNHHDEFDTRVNQPVGKTLGRTVPISPETERQLLEEYIKVWRAEIPGVGFSNEDFIFVNHRAGRTQGRPVTKSAFNSAITQLGRVFPNLQVVHPHLLRHDWNYRFSCRCDEEKWTVEDERESREILMGWKHDSPMSQLYNRRHIQEKANEIGRKVASDTQRRTG